MQVKYRLFYRPIERVEESLLILFGGGSVIGFGVAALYILANTVLLFGLIFTTIASSEHSMLWNLYLASILLMISAISVAVFICCVRSSIKCYRENSDARARAIRNRKNAKQDNKCLKQQWRRECVQRRAYFRDLKRASQKSIPMN